MPIEEAFAYTVVAIFGLLLGSFANVVIHRLPLGQSVVFPRSRCPKCSAAIAAYDNIPVFSWLWLRGRCRACKAWISVRYPGVELLTSLTFVAIFARFGWSWSTVEYLYFAWALIVVSFIDLDLMILPDVFTLSGIVIGLVGSLANPEREFVPALAGALLGGGFLYVIAYLYLWLRKEEGMGGGDIKLLAWIGATLTWESVPFVILCSSILGSLIGIFVAFRRTTGLRSEIPFGPFIAASAIIYLLGGDVIGRWYIGLFLPASTSVN